MTPPSKWDKPLATYKKLWNLECQKVQLLKELGQSISYHRALELIQIDKLEVSHPIKGSQVSAIDNYKVEQPIKLCKQAWCSQLGKPQSVTLATCPECQSPLEISRRRISPAELRGKLSSFTVGVVTKDGRRHWFPTPLNPQPWLEEINQPETV